MRGIKIAIAGKGGVGKSTLAAALALLMADRKRRVLALDADPAANFAIALGMPPETRRKITPISRQKALVEERTGAKVSQYGQMFKINPEVSDIADKYASHFKGVSLLVLGAIEKGGAGCACPESVLLKALVTDLVLHRNEALIMDMEAGLEHLGRATAGGVDAMLVVVEPGARSVECAETIIRMAADIRIKKIFLVANKITCPEDECFVRASFPGRELLAAIPFSETIRKADIRGASVLDGLEKTAADAFVEILDKLERDTA